MTNTLSLADATTLYHAGLAFIEGTYGLTTRTAFYQWDTNEQVYEATHAGLRVVHNIGVYWNGRRFVPCDCAHCERYPETAAQVDIHGYPHREEY